MLQTPKARINFKTSIRVGKHFFDQRMIFKESYQQNAKNVKTCRRKIRHLDKITVSIVLTWQRMVCQTRQCVEKF